MDFKKQDTTICCLKGSFKLDIDRFKMEERKDIPANGNQERAGVAILITDKIDFKSKTLTRNTKGHYILMGQFIKEI